MTTLRNWIKQLSPSPLRARAGVRVKYGSSISFRATPYAPSPWSSPPMGARRYAVFMAMLLVSLLLLLPVSAHAANAPAAAIDEQVQSLKSDVLNLNRDLFVLEEELLFPSSTQVAVFLSLDVGTFFKFDSAQIKIDDKVVSNYLYTARELEALRRGGVHRIYMGNLGSGKHELVALFTGQGPHERDYRRGATLDFVKSVGPKYIELKIVDKEGKQQPDFQIREWE